MKKFSIFLVSALVALSVSAQEAQNVSHGTTYLKNKASDNWYMGIGAGANMYSTRAENNAKAKFLDRPYWMGQLEVGYWINPVLGLRTVLDVGQIKHVANVPMGKKQSWVGTQFNLMYNVINAWGTYDPDRVYNLIPYVGFGYMYGLKADWKLYGSSSDLFHNQNQAFTTNVGVINNFQISRKVALFLEVGYRLLQDTFDGTRSGEGGYHEYDGMFTCVAGVKFGLGGKQHFTPAELMDYNLINDLNSQINRLRAENEDLSKRPKSCPECPEVQPQTIVNEVYVPNVVFFRIDSYKIDKDQQISVYNTAEYMKAHPNAKVNIVAYADKKTGNPKYNFALSEKRAKAVAKSLTSEYGISSDRISLDWKGDTEQPYAENNWNRVAIFFVD